MGKAIERSDWTAVPEGEALKLRGSPGIQWVKGEWRIHRSHLPLLPNYAPHNPVPRWPRFADGTELRAHQARDIGFLREREGALLANQMRMGKTASIVGSHREGKLVVCGPLATRHVWRAWIRRRFGEDAPIAELAGRTFDREAFASAEFVFVHYDVLPSWYGMGFSQRVATLAFDEAHLLANWRSKRSEAAHALATMSERTIVSTGTPLWNRLGSLWSLLTIANPAAWGSYWDFTARWSNGAPGEYGWTVGDPDERTAPELAARLGEVMRALVWADLGEVPVTRRTIHTVELPPSERRDLDMAVMGGRSESAREPTVVGDMQRYRRVLAERKAEAAARLAWQVAGRERRPVVVWVWHTECADRVVEGLVRLGHDRREIFRVTGSGKRKVSAKKREEILDRWRGSEAGVLVMSIMIGQAGIDLSHAADAVVAELDWTPATVSQLEMRTFSPIRESRIWYVVADHDVDQRFAATLAEKCEVAKLLGVSAADVDFGFLRQGERPARADEVDMDAMAADIARAIRERGTTYEHRLRAGRAA